MEWFLMALKKYAEFNGRSRRKEYWMFVLFQMIFAIVAMLLDNVLGLASESIGYGPIYGVFALAMFLPGLAVSVRRLHDVNKSGWMMLIALIPLIGAIWLLVLFVTEGTRGPNKYGLDPKNPENELDQIGVDQN
jgi:uncharacterized membrane protein YhaH (DUF805 family)